MKKPKLDLASSEKVAAIISSLMSVTAIIVGAYWTYLLAIKERRFEPRANIEHKMEHVALSDKINLLRVVVKITNTGDAELVAQDSKVVILRIVPLTLKRIGEAEGIDIIENLQMQSDGVEAWRPTEAFSWPMVAGFCTKREDLQTARAPMAILSFKFHAPSVLTQSFFADLLNTTKPASPNPPAPKKEIDEVEPSPAAPDLMICKSSREGESLTIRPKEYAELSYEFAVDSRIKVVNVYTFYQNQNKPLLGWELTSLYDFRAHQQPAEIQPRPAASPGPSAPR